MDLINNLIPTGLYEKDFLKKYILKKYKKIFSYDSYDSKIDKWHFNDKIYAKIYFQKYSVDNNDTLKIKWESIICKSKYFHSFKRKANSVKDYIVEFYTDKDFEINPIWENIYTDE